MKNKAIVVLILLSFACLLAQENIAPQDESFDPAVLKEPPLPMLDNTLIYEVVTDLKPLTKPPVNNAADSIVYIEKMGWKVLDGDRQVTHPHPSFSPDNKWVLYTSDEEGMPALYLAQV